MHPAVLDSRRRGNDSAARAFYLSDNDKMPLFDIGQGGEAGGGKQNRLEGKSKKKEKREGAKDSFSPHVKWKAALSYFKGLSRGF